MLNESDFSRIDNALWVLNVYKSEIIDCVSRLSKFYKDDLTEEAVQVAFKTLFVCRDEIYESQATMSILAHLSREER